MKLLKRGALCLFLMAGVAGYSTQLEPELLLERDVTVGQREGADGYIRILFFSDTHFGSNYPAQQMERLVEKINAAQADLVLFGGDFMDSYYLDPPDVGLLTRHLANIQAKYGKFAVYGNHDYGGGAAQAYASALQQGGFTLLQNQNVCIEPLQVFVAGLDDPLMGRPDESVASDVPTGYGQILMCHEPDIATRLDLSQVSLMLSGHTHGGQVNLPVLKHMALPPGGRQYVKGLYQVGEGGTPLYVSSGVGTTKLRVRLFNAPEVVTIHLYQTKK